MNRRPIARVAAALFNGGWPVAPAGPVIRSDRVIPEAVAAPTLRTLADEADHVLRLIVEHDACDELAGFPALAARGHVPAPLGPMLGCAAISGVL